MNLTRRDLLTSTAAFLAAGGLRLPLTGAVDDLPTTGDACHELADLDALLLAFAKENAVPGMTVAIARAGKLVYARGFGHGDADCKIAVEPGALFRIASVSKPITAVGVLQLVDTGKVNLDDPALKYVTLRPFLVDGAEPDKRWEKITVRQCLQHTGGWDRDKKGSFDPIAVPGRITHAMKLDHAPRPDDIVRYMMGRRLDFDPGTMYAYSNLGYLVLGRIIEAITAQKYEPWIRKHVLAPVSAGSMVLGRGLPENRAKGEVAYHDSKPRTGRCLYPPRVGEQVPLPDGASNIEGYEAHGGWVASAVDLVRFASAFNDPARSPLLSAGAIQEMWARPAGPPGFDKNGKPRPSYYGCGWNVRPIDDTSRITASHDGLIPGTSALLTRRPDGIVCAVLFNADANPKGTILASQIGRPLQSSITRISKWPDRDLFEKYLAGK